MLGAARVALSTSGRILVDTESRAYLIDKCTKLLMCHNLHIMNVPGWKVVLIPSVCELTPET